MALYSNSCIFRTSCLKLMKSITLLSYDIRLMYIFILYYWLSFTCSFNAIFDNSCEHEIHVALYSNSCILRTSCFKLMKSIKLRRQFIFLPFSCENLQILHFCFLLKSSEKKIKHQWRRNFVKLGFLESLRLLITSRPRFRWRLQFRIWCLELISIT